MAKKYTYIRVSKEAKKALDDRLNKINNVDIKKIGLKNVSVPQIEFTKFLFTTPIFISNMEIRKLARKRGGIKC